MYLDHSLIAAWFQPRTYAINLVLRFLYFYVLLFVHFIYAAAATTTAAAAAFLSFIFNHILFIFCVCASLKSFWVFLFIHSTFVNNLLNSLLLLFDVVVHNAMQSNMIHEHINEYSLRFPYFISSGFSPILPFLSISLSISPLNCEPKSLLFFNLKIFCCLYYYCCIHLHSTNWYERVSFISSLKASPTDGNAYMCTHSGSAWHLMILENYAFKFFLLFLLFCCCSLLLYNLNSYFL